MANWLKRKRKKKKKKKKEKKKKKKRHALDKQPCPESPSILPAFLFLSLSLSLFLCSPINFCPLNSIRNDQCSFACFNTIGNDLNLITSIPSVSMHLALTSPLSEMHRSGLTRLMTLSFAVNSIPILNI